MISFVETKLFTRLVQEYLSDEEYSQLQLALTADPEVGVVIPGRVECARCAGVSPAEANVEVYVSSTFCVPGKGRFGW